jgi:hypothetical protein
MEQARTIYVIENELTELLEEIAEADGEITPELEKRFDALNVEKDNKIEGTARYIQYLQSMVAAAKEEKKRLSEVQKRYEARIESLENLLFQATGANYKQETPIGKIWWRASDQVVMLEGYPVPDEYTRTKTVVEPNKPQIAGAIKDGKDISFALLRKNYSLQIR